MVIDRFPSTEEADEYGLLAIGGDLEVSSLLLAYSQGIFPWPISDEFPLAWFSPDPRGVLDYQDFHISTSLKKILKSDQFEVRFNTNFKEVIDQCAKVPRKSQQGTWITPQIINAFIQLHKSGHAYSVEVYNNQTQQLVGGLYGTCIGNTYSGESMFHLESNASKVALAYLMEKLHAHGINWLDTQMVTPVVESMGGKEIPRKEFIKRIKLNQKKPEFNVFDQHI